MGYYRGYSTTDLHGFVKYTYIERGIRDAKSVYKQYRLSGGKLSFEHIVRGLKPYKRSRTLTARRRAYGLDK